MCTLFKNMYSIILKLYLTNTSIYFYVWWFRLFYWQRFSNNNEIQSENKYSLLNTNFNGSSDDSIYITR